MTTITTNNHEIEISKPDKIMFPGLHLSKEDLVQYYHKVADYIIPYLKDRPLVMHRYPNGIDNSEFYQKEEPDYFPGWIEVIEVNVKQKEKNIQKLVNCKDEATLLYLVNQGTITPHIWLSEKKNLNFPDKMIFDLDPPENNFDLVRQAALDLKKHFDERKMKSFAMTTGSKGMHVIIPLKGDMKYNESRKIAREVANELSSAFPDQYTTEQRKNKRQGRLFLDYLRNSYGQTAVAPYSLRARKGAPVATPLDWDEVKDKDLDSRTYHHGNIFRRLGNKKDPWKELIQKK